MHPGYFWPLAFWQDIACATISLAGKDRHAAVNAKAAQAKKRAFLRANRIRARGLPLKGGCKLFFPVFTRKIHTLNERARPSLDMGFAAR